MGMARDDQPSAKAITAVQARKQLLTNEGLEGACLLKLRPGRDFPFVGSLSGRDQSPL